MYSISVIGLLERLLSFLPRISFRIWFVVIAFFIASGPIYWLQIPSVDRFFLNLSSYLLDIESGAAEIAVIEVSDSEFSRWENDVYDSGKLTSVLANIFYGSDSKVGILFDKPQPLELNQLEIAVLNANVERNTVNLDGSFDFQKISKRKQYLYELLANPRVTLGAVQPELLSPILTTPDTVISEQFYSWFWRWCVYCLQTSVSPNSYLSDGLDSQAIPATHLSYYYQPATMGVELPLLSRDDRNHFALSFLFQLYYSNTESSVRWNPFVGLNVGDRDIQTSFGGSVISLNEISHRWFARRIRMSLDEALAVNTFPAYVLIMPSKYSALSKPLVNGLYGLVHEQLLFKPWWLDVASRLFVCLSALVFVFLVTRVHHKVFTIVILSLAGSALLLDVTIILLAGWWLSLSAAFIWFFVAWLALSVWERRRQRLAYLVELRDKNILDLSTALTEKEFLKESYELLRLYSSPKHLKAELYNLGDKLYQRGDVISAQTVFQFLISIDKSYRDIQFRLELGEKTIKQKTRASSKIPVKKPPKSNVLAIKNMGRYQVERELGRGAMGVVYLGYDPNIARSVAIKVLNYEGLPAAELADIKARFFREAKAAGRLSHPNIVSIYDVGEQADFAFIAMDFVSGQPLSNLIRNGKQTSAFDVYRIIHDVALALEYAHQNGIVHRDIKPGNIMHSVYPYQVKVADFGIARLMDASKTSTGEIFGSPLYMSPEQLKGEKVGPASDVYSLGVTFYQLLSGQLPFAGDNLASLAYDVIHGKPKALRSVRKGLPASAARIINQCLQKNVNDRYESAGELASALNKAIRRDFASQAKKVGFIV